MYDELANADSLVTWNPAYECRRLLHNAPHAAFEADGIVMDNNGYVCSHHVLPYATNTTQMFFRLSGTAFGLATEADGHITIGRSDATAGTARIKIDCFFRYPGGGNNLTFTEYLDLPFSTSAARDVFFVLSWDQVLNSGTAQGSQLDLVLYAIYDGKVVKKEMSLTGARVETSGYLHYDIGTGISTAIAYSTYFYASLGDSIKNEWQALSLQRFMPLYPLEAVGAYNEFAVNDASSPGLSYVNSNLTIEAMSLVLDERPGRIQWGAYGAMPSLNEGSINEEILRIASLKSAMPTDEHNTILIFTENNVYRMALLGDNAKTCVIIPELMNTGLVHVDALCITTNGIAWMSRLGLLLLQGGSVTNITSERIIPGTVTRLVYDAENDWLWLHGTEIYVYQIRHDVWFKYHSEHQPDDFIGALSNAKGWVTYADGVMYKKSNTLNTGEYAPKIVTAAYKVAKKLGRFNVVASLIAGAYKVAVKLYSMAIAGSNETTSTYTGYYGKLTAIPGTSCDYAQIILTEIDGIVGIEIENISGK